MTSPPMWQTQSNYLSPNHILHFQITANEALLSYTQVMDLWQNAAPFRSYFNKILSEIPFEAYYWEVAPMTQAKTSLPFEFVVINSAPLRHIIPDKSAFQEYFTLDKAVVDFLNLGKDARLIVPTPIAEINCYPHLAQFVRNAPTEQIDAFWQRLGEVYAASLHEQPLWLSTAGLGVSWLHLRLDSRPKYYRYEGYKNHF